jgi:hypothetical protein
MVVRLLELHCARQILDHGDICQQLGWHAVSFLQTREAVVGNSDRSLAVLPDQDRQYVKPRSTRL